MNQDIQLNSIEVSELKTLLQLIRGNDKGVVITLKFAYEEYLVYARTKLSEKSLLSINLAFKHLIKYFGQQKVLSSIDQREVEKFIADLQKHAPSGYRVYFRTLKAAFNKFVDWGYITDNPFIKIKMSKQQKTKPLFINEQQLDLICEKIDLDVVKQISQLSFFTGLRLSECSNIKWSNVDLNERLLTVGDEQFLTKARRVRVVPLCESAVKILKAAHNKKKAKYDYVFCKKNGYRFTGDYISKRFKKACKLAGVDKRIHFHSLRHSFASNLVQKGVPLYTVKELLGHSSIACTEIYSHLNLDTLIEAVNKI